MRNKNEDIAKAKKVSFHMLSHKRADELTHRAQSQTKIIEKFPSFSAEESLERSIKIYEMPPIKQNIVSGETSRNNLNNYRRYNRSAHSNQEPICITQVYESSRIHNLSECNTARSKLIRDQKFRAQLFGIPVRK